MVKDRRLMLRPSAHPHVYVLDELEYNPGDALTFARRALAAVEAFVDGMLDAFEDGKREIETRRAARVQI
jgi:hypothetical protein